MDWKKYGFVIAGDLRSKIVLNLQEPRSPAQLTSIIKTQDSAISRCLRDLEKEGIAQQINPGVRKGRLFSLTEEGEKIRKKLFS